MQYLKIEIPKKAGGMIEYPAGYNDLEHFIKDHLFTDENKGDEEKQKTFLCVALKDGIDFKKILGDLDRVTEMTKEEMVAYCTPFEQRREVITDEARVRRLAIKAQLGRPFTEEENKAMNPEDDSVAGFGMSKRFVDRI